MKLLRDAEKLLAHRLLPIWVYAVSLASILAAQSRVTDVTHEIELVGSAWFRGGSIPLAQAYSHFSPFTLYVGSLYHQFITSTFTEKLLDIALFTLLALAFNSWLAILHPKNRSYRHMLLLVGASILAIPGVWQNGISPTKLGLLLVSGLYFSFAKWKMSTKSYWLMGETSKNWRYLLLCGVLLSALVYTSLLITLFAIPFFVQFITLHRKQAARGLRNSLLLLTPIILQSWVWYSYFASRHLLTEALRAAALDFHMFTHAIRFDFLLQAGILFPLLVVVAIMLVAIRGENYTKDRKTWVIGLGLLEGLLVSRAGILHTLPLLLLMAAPLYSKKLRPVMIALWSVLAIVISVPYHLYDSASARLTQVRATMASSYVSLMSNPDYVLYYGRGAGFYKLSGLSSPTRYLNSSVLAYDNPSLQLIDKFRGDNEANTPLYVVYVTDKETRVGTVPRIEEYFTKHYEKVADLDGYIILKRK